MTIMRSYSIAVAALSALLASGAQAADILEACGADIEARCADVEPGHGRIAACLYAHEDKVSDACDAAMADTANALDLFFHGLWEIKTACGDDIRSQCDGIPPGEGRILSCLQENASALSESCATMVDTIRLPERDG